MSPREKIVNTNMEYEVRAMCKVFNALDDASTVSAHGGQHSNVMELPYRPDLCIHAGIGKEYPQKEIKKAHQATLPSHPSLPCPIGEISDGLPRRRTKETTAGSVERQCETICRIKPRDSQRSHTEAYQCRADGQVQVGTEDHWPFAGKS